MTPSEPSPPPRRSWVPPAIVGALAFAAFVPALAAEFTNWDDDINLSDNPAYRGLSWSHLKWMFTTFRMGHWQPLPWVTLGLDYCLWGMKPFGYHLTSVLIHAANAVLLYFAIRALLRLAGHAPSPWPAAAGAMAWAVHPLRVESVAWVTERRDVLCGFFALLSVLAWLKHVEEERAGRQAARWLALSCAAFAAALMSKALAIFLPVVLLVLDVHPLGRFAPGARRRALLEKAPYVLLSGLDGIVMMFAMRHIDAVRPLASYAPVERLAQAAYGLCFYPLKTAWPSGLIPLQRIESPMNPFSAKYLLAFAAVASLTAFLIVRRRSFPGSLAAWLSYVVLVLPVLGIVVTGGQIAADRYSYLALMPVSFLAAAFLERLSLPRSAALGSAAAALLALAVATWQQCGYWKDSVALWSRQLEFDSGDPFVWIDRGQARYLRGDAAGAMADCSRALEIHPGAARAYNLRGVLRRDQGDAAGARQDFDAALRLMPDYDTARTNRGDLRRTQGDLRGAMEDAEAVLRHDPLLGGAYLLRAGVHFQSGRATEALVDYERALALKPDDPMALVGRGQVKHLLGDRAGGIADLERALAVAGPGWPLRSQVESLLTRLRSP